MGTPIKWTEEMDALLGTMSDYDVGDKLGINQMSACRRRHELDLASFQPYTAEIQWTPKMVALLGTMSDAKVANQLGVHRSTVCNRRQMLGIPSWYRPIRILPVGMTTYSLEAKRIFDSRRRHRKLELPDTLTWEQWIFACKYFNNACAYCGAKTSLGEDHLVPISKGGGRVVLNIIPACWPCNRSKGATKAHLWIYDKFGREEGQKIGDRVVAYLTEIKSKQQQPSCG